MTAEIIPHPSAPPDPEPERSERIEVVLPPPMARIAPGRYQARSAKLGRFQAYKRDNVRLDFEVYGGEAGTSAILARVPMFFRLPAGRRGLSPRSKLAHALYLAGTRPARRQKVLLEVLLNHLWTVEVADVPSGEYSIVSRIVERRA